MTSPVDKTQQAVIAGILATSQALIDLIEQQKPDTQLAAGRTALKECIAEAEAYLKDGDMAHVERAHAALTRGQEQLGSLE